MRFNFIGDYNGNVQNLGRRSDRPNLLCELLDDDAMLRLCSFLIGYAGCPTLLALFLTCKEMKTTGNRLTKPKKPVCLGLPIPILGNDVKWTTPMLKKREADVSHLSTFHKFLLNSSLPFEKGPGNSDLFSAQLVSAEHFRVYANANCITLTWCGLDPDAFGRLGPEAFKIASVWATDKLKEMTPWEKFSAMIYFLGGTDAFEERGKLLVADATYQECKIKLGTSREMKTVTQFEAGLHERNLEAARKFDLAAYKLQTASHECSLKLKRLKGKLAESKEKSGGNEVETMDVSEWLEDVDRVTAVNEATLQLQAKVGITEKQAQYYVDCLEMVNKKRKGIPEALKISLENDGRLKSLVHGATDVVNALTHEEKSLDAERKKQQKVAKSLTPGSDKNTPPDPTAVAQT